MFLFLFRSRIIYYDKFCSSVCIHVRVSSHSYCCLCLLPFTGVGGHGGSGRHSDIKRKYQDIIAQMKQHVQPISPKLILQGNKPGQAPSDSTSTAPSSASRSQHSHSDPGRPDSGETGLEVGVAPRVAVTKCAVCTVL